MLCLRSRKDDWPDKRMAMDDRYNRSDFGRQERYQDFDHRDRGRYQDDTMMDRRDNSRGMGGNRDGQVRGRPEQSQSFCKTFVSDAPTGPKVKSNEFRISSLASTSLTEETDMAETAGSLGVEASTNA